MTTLFPAAAAVLSNIIWGSSFMASKIVLAGRDPIVVTIFRFSIAASAMLIFGIIKKNNFQIQVFKNRFSEIVLLGIVGYSGLYYFQMTGLQTVSSSHSAAIMLLAPIVTLIFNSFLNRRIRLFDFATVLVSFLGAFLILNQRSCFTCSESEGKGLFMTMAAAICLGASVLQTRRLLQPSGKNKDFLTVFNLTFYSMLVGVAGLLIASFYKTQPESFNLRSDLKNFWSWLLYLGLVCSVLAFLVWNWAIKYASPTIVALSMYLKTPVAFGLGAVLLSEKLDYTFYCGSVLILASLIFSQFYKIDSKKQ